MNQNPQTRKQEILQWLDRHGGREALISQVAELATRNAPSMTNIERIASNAQRNVNKALQEGLLRPRWAVICMRLGGPYDPPFAHWFGMAGVEQFDQPIALTSPYFETAMSMGSPRSAQA